MHTTGQAGIKAANCSHDINALEVVRAILFEDRRILHSIFIRARGAIDISYTAIPWGGWIRVVVRDLPIFDHHMMGKHTSYGLVESTTNSFVWDCKFGPGFAMSGTYLIKSLIDKVQCSSC